MTTPSRRRLLRDYKRVMLDPPVGIMAAPEKDDLMQWQAVIFGPDDTPFEGGTFKLQMKFTEEYPNKPPIVKFVTKLFHPNIYTDGAICLDILANQWSPIYDVAAILASIQSLLTDPNPNSPANVEAAKLYVENRREYDRKVCEVIENLWKQEESERGEDDDDDDDDEEEEEEDAEAAPKKKRKLSATTALASNSTTPTTTATPASSSSSSSSSIPAAAATSSASSLPTATTTEATPSPATATPAAAAAQ